MDKGTNKKRSILTYNYNDRSYIYMEEKKNNDKSFDLAMAMGELKEDVGELNGHMEGVLKHLELQNGSIATLQKKMQKHEILFGKIGIAVAAIGFGVSAFISVIAEWIKTKLF